MLEKLLEIFKIFIFYFVEISVLFIAIAFIVALLNQKFSKKMERYLSANSLLSYIKAMFLGALTPFCSCSTIPLLSGLLKSGVSFGVSVAYLLVSPLVNPIIIAMLVISFGLKLSLFYILFIFVFVFIFSLSISKFDSDKFLNKDFIKEKQNTAPKYHNISKQNCCQTKIINFSTQKQSLNSNSQTRRSYKNLFIKVLKDYKKLLPYIIIGMSIGALIHGFVPKEFLQTYLDKFEIFSVVVAAFVGVLLYIRVEAIIPIGLSLMDCGVSLGAVMSFLIAGGGCSLPELILLKRIFKMNFLLIFISCVLFIAIIFGVLIDIGIKWKI
ncbi:permease [Campylobacter hyointestinalis]|uniref:permease n=1 Tax=Campylobacter hyointestinalis TaxID=198 RepID=UPI000DCB5295|nr:permease [Campylobacter hyointestinalis]RAZ23603.1 permease [Campylobacter hyointestinalis subsp. lawsonii]RAZ37504.1 permease [Campylobacter hyointestinalis subsp. lawsonii]